MKLNIKIKQNDFVKPTEIRESVVQGIVDYFMTYKINEGAALFSRTFHVGNNDIIFVNQGMLRAIPREKVFSQRDTNWGMRVHSVEMEAAFEVIKSAGYHFYASYNITQREHSFIFSKYPINGEYETPEAHFGLCVD